MLSDKGVTAPGDQRSAAWRASIRQAQHGNCGNIPCPDTHEHDGTPQQKPPNNPRKSQSAYNADQCDNRKKQEYRHATAIQFTASGCPAPPQHIGDKKPDQGNGRKNKNRTVHDRVSNGVQRMKGEFRIARHSKAVAESLCIEVKSACPCKHSTKYGTNKHLACHHGMFPRASPQNADSHTPSLVAAPPAVVYWLGNDRTQTDWQERRVA